MTFEELSNFVEKRMKMSHVYQPLLIKALIEAGGSATFRQIALNVSIIIACRGFGRSSQYVSLDNVTDLNGFVSIATGSTPQLEKEYTVLPVLLPIVFSRCVPPYVRTAAGKEGTLVRTQSSPQICLQVTSSILSRNVIASF